MAPEWDLSWGQAHSHGHMWFEADVGVHLPRLDKVLYSCNTLAIRGHHMCAFGKDMQLLLKTLMQ